MPFSGWEIVVVLVIVLIIFGPKRLPDLGRSLGSGMREFKDSVTGNNKDDEKQIDSPDSRRDPVTSEKSEASPAGGQRS